ncbi:MAG TPA: polysaccharide deacetylase family protein [Candidatus Saccharimonadales bacterium]|nr:polysaccharide deacetylase family protein [Candidatus Saccharimonadales bacterium]
MLTLTSCDLLSAESQPVMTTTPVSTPILTPRNPPQPNYHVDYCGVSKAQYEGQPSNVLLTIDDYPADRDAERMIRIADWARQAGVMMEAFPIKSKTDAHKKATGIDLVEELRTRGTYVSNHSLSHRELTQLSQNEVLEEVRQGIRSTYLRPPYGSYTSIIKQLVESEGYRLCLWNIDTNDWRKINGKYPSVEELVRRVHLQLQEIPTGTPVVILGHYYTNYPDALQSIVEEVEAMGNRICPTPAAPVTEEVPYPIC